jgi:predicted nucleic acid-binding Zn ribbon protein
MRRPLASDEGGRGKPPQKIGNVLSALFARKGYGQVQSALALADAWERAAGPQLSRASRPGNIRRGVLEVMVLNSGAMQELNFRKKQLLATLGKLAPEQGIKDVRFKLGHFES